MSAPGQQIIVSGGATSSHQPGAAVTVSALNVNVNMAQRTEGGSNPPTAHGPAQHYAGAVMATAGPVGIGVTPGSSAPTALDASHYPGPVHAAGGPVTVSGLSVNPNVSVPSGHGSHYAGSLSATPMQPIMPPKQSSQSYAMGAGITSSVSAHDNNEENVPVSIHVSSNAIGGPSDPGPSSGPPEPHQGGQTSERLKVEDALNYLDQVKYKFGNQPQVYNDFLDIMKEFKSQSIDTPGVISRVSNLFKGHPELIVGFNTFLPPGYKIEVQTHDQGAHQISYRVDGVTNYVVTNMPPCLPSGTASNHASIHTTTAPQIIQHATTPGAPMRSISHASHASGIVSNSYGSNSSPAISGGVPSISNSSLSNGRTVSPPPAAPVAAASANYDSSGPTSSFTHSFSSPFVQNAFPTLQSQPVEFNQAINYVNKIKNRFCGQPEKYKQFLEILHTYQKEQRNIKEGQPLSSKHLTEHEVYSQVAKLFENQEDLLQEFGKFLPDTTNHSAVDVKPIVEQPKKPVKAAVREYNPPASSVAAVRTTHITSAKRSTTGPPHPVSKKPKLSTPLKDISLAEAARYGTLHDYSFFDKVRSMVKHPEVYENFLRCLSLFNREILSRQELLTLVQPFFSKSPEMFAWLKDFVKTSSCENDPSYEPVSQHTIKLERPPEEQILEIGEECTNTFNNLMSANFQRFMLADFSTCKRLGASYCALPKNHVPAVSSGRTPLEKEVLNDVWVSFPTWSEDSTFVTSRKTQYEEYICRCEDERFELDVIIEANADTIRIFESVARKMSRMSSDELNKFELDDKLGGSSDTIHKRTVRRVYGDKADEIIEGLKRNPGVTIPIVLKRLKLKEEEWRESQKNFNKIWREQVERFYLKSLDHQGITFKQSDIRMLRSKSLVNEIEALYDERHDQEMDPGNQPLDGPHMTLQYGERSVLDDACNLLLHHVRRQSGIQNDDKRKIKQLLKHFIPDLFKHTRMELSDDEVDDLLDDEDRRSPSDYLGNGPRNGKRGSKRYQRSKKDDEDDKEGHDVSKNPANESRRNIVRRELKQAMAASSRGRRKSDSFKDLLDDVTRGGESDRRDFEDPSHIRVIQIPNPADDETYTLFYINTAWYVFLRLHHILCERLNKMLDVAAKLLADETKGTVDPKLTPAYALRMKHLADIEVQDYYPTFLEMVKNLLDGNMEPSAYEDTLREMFGIHAYIAYTMDKLVTNAVRQLQTLVSDDASIKFTELFHAGSKKHATGGSCMTAEQRLGLEISYHKQAEKIDVEENCYRTIIYHKAFRMTMELLEGVNSDENGSGFGEAIKWNTYIDTYVKEKWDEIESCRKQMKPIVLKRNLGYWIRLYNKFANRSSPNLGKEESHGAEDNQVKMETSMDGEVNEKRKRSTGKKCPLLNTNAAVTPEEAEELEMLLNINLQRRADIIKTEFEHFEHMRKIKVAASTNMPVSPEEAAALERQLESNQKKRTERKTGLSSGFVAIENLQARYNSSSYRMVYVKNSGDVFYMKGSLRRAKACHKKVTTRMNEAFGKWHQAWLEDNVSEDQITRCEDWLMNVKNSLTRIVSSNDISLAPYRPFNRYVVLKSM